MTYGQLGERWEELEPLIKKVAGKGSIPIGILLPNGLEFVPVCFSAWSLRCVAVPLNVQSRPEEIERICSLLGINVIVTDAERLRRLEGKVRGTFIIIREDMKGEVYTAGKISSNISLPWTQEHAVVFLTSGTTGQAKVVALTHDNILCHLDEERRQIPLSLDHPSFLCAPLCHSYAFKRQMLGILCFGGTIYISHREKASTQFLQEIMESRSRSIYAVPAIYRMILGNMKRMKDRESIKNIKVMVNGTASMPRELLRELLETIDGGEMYLTYGLSEACPLVSCLCCERGMETEGAIGYPAEGIDMKIGTEEGLESLQPGLEGELFLRGRGVITEYFACPEVNRQAFCEGYLRTGDIVRVSDDGSLYILGRCKDVINRAGEKIFPEEIEAVISRYEGVMDVAVIGVPHPVLGEVPFAYITVQPSISIKFDHFLSMCSKNLPSSMWLWGVRVVSELPRTATGKICKAELAKRYQNA